MAMVNRKPWGGRSCPFSCRYCSANVATAPNHSCVHTPQNEAFLSGLRNAKTSVFIQTPNLNAEPLLPAMLEACRRGVDVFAYVCLGYNDAVSGAWPITYGWSESNVGKGELLPFQGGTNEMVAHKLFIGLEPEHKKHLHYYFYVAKDMTKPIHNKFKKRSCHGKSARIPVRWTG